MRAWFCVAGLLACAAQAPPRASAPSPVVQWLAEAKLKACASAPLSITYPAEAGTDPQAREMTSLRCDAKGARIDVTAFESGRPVTIEYPLEPELFERIWKSVLARVDERGCVTRRQAAGGAAVPNGAHVVGLSAGEPIACSASEAWNPPMEMIREAGANARTRYSHPAADCCKGEPPCVLTACW